MGLPTYGPMTQTAEYGLCGCRINASERRPRFMLLASVKYVFLGVSISAEYFDRTVCPWYRREPWRKRFEESYPADRENRDAPVHFGHRCPSSARQDRRGPLIHQTARVRQHSTPSARAQCGAVLRPTQWALRKGTATREEKRIFENLVPATRRKSSASVVLGNYLARHYIAPDNGSPGVSSSSRAKSRMPTPLVVS